uniref:Uncharacterized protein n=1 Tax=Setaria italica TaxID=4555 RepID=K3XR34_SETIT
MVFTKLALKAKFYLGKMFGAITVLRFGIELAWNMTPNYSVFRSMLILYIHFCACTPFPEISPQPENNFFDKWWASTNIGIDGQARKGLNSVIILGAWCIWNHHNRCVFDGIQLSLNEVLASVRDELQL